MSDLITSTRAQLSINQSEFSDNEETQIQTLITAVSAAIQRWTRNNFVSTSHDELYDGVDETILRLRQYPLLTVSAVWGNPATVLRIQNNNASVQRATVAVTATGLTLSRTASAVTTTNTITFAGNVTLQALKDAIDAVGNGWSATLPVSSHALFPSADLRFMQGSLPAYYPQAANLKVHIDQVDDFETDDRRGWLIRHSVPTREFFEAYDTCPSPWSGPRNAWRVQYTAGYDAVPEDVQEACAEWVAAMYWQTKDNPAVYPGLPPATAAVLLMPYRRSSV